MTGPGRRGTLAPLALVSLAVGVSVSLYYPFLALFVSTEVGAGPVRTTAFLVAAPLAGVASSWLVGRLSDRWPIRRGLLVVTAVAGAVGAAGTAVVRDYWAVLALAVTAFALSNALFPQSLAYAREVLQRGDPSRAALGTSSLRTLFSIAWVGGPPLGAALLRAGGFRWVYLAVAVAFLVAASVAFLLLRPLTPEPARAPPLEAATRLPAVPVPDGVPPAPEVAPPPTVAPVAPAAPRSMLLLVAVAFTLLQTPLTLGPQALPLYASRELGGEVSDAGLILGLCAALEIPLILGFGWLSTRIALRTLILTGGVAGVLYFAIVTAATGVGVVLAAQVVNATFIAAVSGLGISYVQDLVPAEPGRATTLFTNTFPVGAMLAGPLFGLAQTVGFRSAFAISTGLCVLGLLALAAARPPAAK